jgi:hypothetical protein
MKQHEDTIFQHNLEKEKLQEAQLEIYRLNTDIQ